MESLPTLTTERLVLTVPSAADAERLAAYHRENREHLAPWEPVRPEAYFTPEYWLGVLPGIAADALADRAFAFVLAERLRPDGPLLGRCALTNIVRGPFQAAYLGFSLAESAVGHGFMFEALSALIPFAFEELNLHRIMANHVPENVRSGKLLARLGFRKEGLAPAYLLIHGAWRDHVLTSLVNSAWRPSEAPRA